MFTVKMFKILNYIQFHSIINCWLLQWQCIFFSMVVDLYACMHCIIALVCISVHYMVPTLQFIYDELLMYWIYPSMHIL